jgi:putative toxin-antitoxin system antitoxin component (TIGR02293 family)
MATDKIDRDFTEQREILHRVAISDPAVIIVEGNVEAGLPVSALHHLADVVAPDDTRFKFRLIPKATLERRRRSNKRLTAEEGDRLARLAKVYSIALDIYHDAAKVRSFLGRPHMMLGNKTPLDVALATGPGADAVINLLGRAAYRGGV